MLKTQATLDLGTLRPCDADHPAGGPGLQEGHGLRSPLVRRYVAAAAESILRFSLELCCIGE